MQTFKERVRGISLIFACGTALFSDGYSNGVINNGNLSLLDVSLPTFIFSISEHTYGSNFDIDLFDNLTTERVLIRIYGSARIEAHSFGTILRSLTFAGTVVGMLLFGYISDKMGRKFGMMSASVIVALFALLSSASTGAHGSLAGMLAMLSTMRFLVGIGIGAEYPCGSVSAAEQSEEENIHRFAQHRWVALATYAMITFGGVFAAFVPLVLFWIFGDNHLRAIWRLSLGLGSIPATLVFLWRLNMDEPTRYRKDSMKRVKIPYKLVLRRYWVSLSAISAIWFLYDFIVYPFDIYSTTILNNITGGNDSIAVIFGWNVVMNLMKVPGAIGGAFLLDFLDPKWTLILALIVQSLVGFLMAGLYRLLADHIAAFAVIYGIFQSLGGVGPGNCTILLAAKQSSTAVRGHYYGVAAATGKLGAFIGTWAFPAIIDAFGGPQSIRGNTGTFWVASGLSLLSAIITLFWVKPMTHDGLIEEDQSFREYLQKNGYDTSMMGLGDNGSSIEASPQGETEEE